MDIFRARSTPQGDVKLEQLWWPLVARCTLDLPKKDSTQVFSVAAFPWPNRYEVHFISIKLSEDAKLSPADLLFTMTIVSPGAKVGEGRDYLDVPVGGLAFDPFGFYTFPIRDKMRLWIPTEGAVAATFTNLGPGPQVGKVIVKLDGLLMRGLGDEKRVVPQHRVE